MWIHSTRLCSVHSESQKAASDVYQALAWFNLLFAKVFVLNGQIDLKWAISSNLLTFSITL